MVGGRQGLISWAEYFMATAKLAEERSKDPVCQVGACIVNRKNQIVSTGYNTMPKGKDKEFTWEKDETDIMNDKSSFVCHAELNAIVNAKSLNVIGCIMYVTRIPCNECAKLINQSGIEEVYYKPNTSYDTKEDALISKKIFQKCNVLLQEWRPRNRTVTIEI